MKKDLGKLRKAIMDCPSLSEEEKSLLIRIDIQGEGVTEVAKSLKKSKSTVSEQHTKAHRKLDEHMKQLTSEDFQKVIFGEFNSGKSPNSIIAKYGHAEEVTRLSGIWKKHEQDDYWKTIQILTNSGAFQGAGERKETEGLLLYGVKALADIVNDVYAEKDDAEEKLQQYEKKYGTFEELAVRIAIMQEELSKLPQPVLKAISLMDIRTVAQNYTERWRREAAEAMLINDVAELQHKELLHNLKFFRTRHGSNIKIGDIIMRSRDSKLEGVMYIVDGESEDKRAWITSLFNRVKMERFEPELTIHGKDLRRRVLPKAEAIENYEVVDIKDF
jgi:hypothetical protein